MTLKTTMVRTLFAGLILISATVVAKRALAVVTPVEPYTIDRDLGGIKTSYTDLVVQTLMAWPPAYVDFAKWEKAWTAPVKLVCYDTPGDEFRVGVMQLTWINAPIERVDQVMSNVEGFKALSPGFKRIELLNRDGNLFSTVWERSIPIPFVPNVVYEMNFVSTHPSPDKIMYRHQLKSSKNIKGTDGITVLEKLPDGRVRYTGFEFLDADWGIAKTFAPGRIWKDTVQGYFLSALVRKLQAENPEWEPKKVVDQARETVEQFGVEECLGNKIVHPLVPGAGAANLAKAVERSGGIGANGGSNNTDGGGGGGGTPARIEARPERDR